MCSLDPRLQQYTLTVGDLPLCRRLLMNDAQYPWFILVPRRAAVNEVFDLDAADQLALWQETTTLASVLKDGFAADKMNVATLGNMVSQLHMHVIARTREDAVWPAPVWGKLPAQPYSEVQLAEVLARLRLLLTDNFCFMQEAS